MESVISFENAAKLRILGLLQGHTATANRYLIGRTGNTMLTIDGMGEIRGWSLREGTSLFKLDALPLGIATWFFSPDETQFGIVTGTQLNVYNAKSGKLDRQITASASPITAAGVNRTASTLIIGDQDGTLSLWKPALAVGNAGTTLIPDKPAQIEFAPLTNRHVVVTHLNRLLLYSELNLIKSYSFQGAVSRLAWSEDGSLLAVSVGETVYVFDGATLNEIGRLEARGQTGRRAMTFSPDGKLLAIGGSGDFVFIWDVLARKQLISLPGHDQGALTWLGWSPDGNLLATVAFSAKGGAYLWNTASFRDDPRKVQRGQLGREGDQIFNGAWSADGKLLILADARSPVLVFGVK
jgi:WD40 repeat protein